MEIRIAFFFSKKKKKVKSLHELFTMVFPHPFCRKQKAVTHLLPLPFSTTTTTTFVSPHPPGDRSCSANEDRTRVCVCVCMWETPFILSLSLRLHCWRELLVYVPSSPSPLPKGTNLLPLPLVESAGRSLARSPLNDAFDAT